MSRKVNNLKQMLPHGAMTAIAKKLGISQPAVSDALDRGRSGHRAVQEALAMAKASGALEAAQTLASIVPAK